MVSRCALAYGFVINHKLISVTWSGELKRIKDSRNSRLVIQQESHEIPCPKEYNRTREMKESRYSYGRLWVRRDIVSTIDISQYPIIDGFIYPTAFIQCAENKNCTILLKTASINAVKLFFKAKNGILQADPLEIDSLSSKTQVPTEPPQPLKHNYVFRDRDLPHLVISR